MEEEKKECLKGIVVIDEGIDTESSPELVCCGSVFMPIRTF